MTWKDGRIKNAERKTEKIHFLKFNRFCSKIHNFINKFYICENI